MIFLSLIFRIGLVFIMKKKSSLWLVLLLGTLSAFGPLSLDMYLPGLPAMTSSLHTSASLIQMSISTCIVGLALGQLVIGPISDRIGRKTPLIIGLAVFAITSFALAFTSNIWIFLAIRFLQGLAGASGNVLSRAIAKDMFTGKKLTRFYANLMSINGVFPVISPIIGSMTMLVGPWNLIFVVLGFIGIFLIINSIFLPETAPKEVETTFSRKSLSTLGHAKDFWQPTLILCMANGVLFCYISGSSFIYQGVFHLNSTQFSLMYALNGCGIAFGSFLAGRMASYFRSKKMVNINLFVTLIIIGLMVLNGITIGSHLLSMIGIFLIIGSFGFTTALATYLAMQVPGINAGVSSAMVGLFGNIAGGISSPLVGLFGTSSPTPMFAIMLIFQVISIAAFYLLNTKKAVA